VSWEEKLLQSAGELFVVGGLSGDGIGGMVEEPAPEDWGDVVEGAPEVEGVAAGLTAGKVAEVGVKIGVEEGIVVEEAFSAGRNSVCLMRPPASAVQMLSAMESAEPRRTAQPIQAACRGYLIRARSAAAARMPAA